ncbi:LOW QUALITY PROTEIN: probable disease resistance protein At1g61300 [Prosopis cineraria]|uniref:LOW QUALITY PROTEIN: probable disease resistance protein At1g61300 n=1 Tax=Prosopis cineraria TaxID=364024 RepID=UPI00240F799B|nr:LOW QUALITY PROTEIN: probable disease resistance protein At1g61300 [Prosopis cineraria]
MELAAPIWDAIKCFCDCTIKQAAFICHLEDNLQSLAEHWTQLQDQGEDVKRMVEQAERNPRMERTKAVNNWLQRVNNFQTTVQDIQNQGATVVQDKCLANYCHKNCLSAYKLGREVVKTFDCVNQLMTEGEKFNTANIACELPRGRAEEMPVPNTVGMDEMRNKVWESIEDSNVGVIGLYGMGGAGKTTLLKKVNNELVIRGHDFALVIWVVVSKDRDIEKIIDDISQNIGIDWKDKSKDEKIRAIFNVMKHKKFLLMLDDIWQGLDLYSIGVPPPREMNHSKVLLTTRFENVCDQMQAKKLQVKCLTNKEAFKLFCMKVGDETLNSDPSIRDLAQKLILECKGLPLPLITIGQAMSGRTNPQSWRHAINKLQSSPAEIKGMEEEVFFIIKFSYDSLPNDMEKKCFLYLALYPEDEIIYILDAILLWIGEGFFGDNHTIDDAFNHGQAVVENLKLACLVEDNGRDFIKLHDVIRDMALWLLRDQDRNKNKILVQQEALKSLKSDNLDVEKISIMMDYHHKETQAWNLPVCPHLVSLLVRNLSIINNLRNLQFLSELKVLSFASIGNVITIPKEIGFLIKLEYFQLSNCKIKKKFPMEMKNLKSLNVFSLQDIGSSVKIIPLEVIPCLERLRVFRFTTEEWMAVNDATEELLLEQLESLPHLEDLSIHLLTPAGINKLSSSELQHCVRDVGVAFHAPTVSSMAKWKRLKEYIFVNCEIVWKCHWLITFNIFCKLRTAIFDRCHSITHLTWLKYAPYLRYLYVHHCALLEEVIVETEDNNDRQNMDGIFANLEIMDLMRMPNLRSIYKKALPFPKLETIWISNCPNLKKLPFDSNSAKYLKKITGQQKWWDELEWEDQALKDLFLPKFQVWPI